MSFTRPTKILLGSILFITLYSGALFTFAIYQPSDQMLDPTCLPTDLGCYVSGGTPSSPLNSIQYNNAGSFYGDSLFTRDATDSKTTTISSNLYAQGVVNDGFSQEVRLQADSIGDIGNNIILVFNGTDDAQTVVDAWNLANPMNTVSIVFGSGTTIPVAGTTQLVGGGQADFVTGTFSSFFGDTQGQGFSIVDATNNLSVFDIVGNLSPLTGQTTLGNVFGTINTNTGALSAGIFTQDGFQNISTDQNTYQASISGDSDMLRIKFNSRELNVSDVGGFQWTNANNSINYIMPDGAHTPALNEVLTVDSISGNDYYLDFHTPTAGGLVGYTKLLGSGGNTALGDQTAPETVGYANTWIGEGAGNAWVDSGVTSSRNTVVGNNAAAAAISGAKNVVIGYQSLWGSTGIIDNSVALGADLISSSANTSNSVILGTDINLSGSSNMIAIGYGLTAINDDEILIGNLIRGNQSTKTINIGDVLGTGDKSIIQIADSVPQINAEVDGRFLLTNTSLGGSTIDAHAVTHNVYIGDVGNVVNKTSVTILDTGKRIIGQTDGQFNIEDSNLNIFLNVDLVNKLYELGDKNNTSTHTFLSVDDNASIVNIYSNNGILVDDNNFHTCTIDPNGGTCTSDQRLKTNIIDLPSNTLDILKDLKTVTYTWNSGRDMTTKHIGFLAQDVESRYPELVSTDPNGYLGVNYAGFTPLLVEAIRELDLKLKPFEDLTTVDNTFAGVLRTWLASAGNGITSIFSREIHTEQVCVKKSDGSEICVNGDQLDILISSSVSSATISSTTGSTTTTTGSSTSGTSGSTGDSVGDTSGTGGATDSSSTTGDTLPPDEGTGSTDTDPSTGTGDTGLPQEGSGETTTGDTPPPSEEGGTGEVPPIE